QALVDLTLSGGNCLSAASFSATSAVHLEPVTWPLQRQKGNPTGTGIRLFIKKRHAIALAEGLNA
ncbi:MAG: hypothetical protein KKF12_19255, partial [Proteobacteria bacterium]|nr:hypothetical protein [Pseudomonadota bacterium]